MRTSAFWLLLSYTVLVYPVQAGVSLHQAANLTEHGISPTMAASTVSLFSLMSGHRQRDVRVDAAQAADPLSDGALAAFF